MGYKPLKKIENVYFSRSNAVSSVQVSKVETFLESHFNVNQYKKGANPYAEMPLCDALICMPVEFNSVMTNSGTYQFSAVLSAGVYKEIEIALSYQIPIIFVEYCSSYNKWYISVARRDDSLHMFRDPDYKTRYGSFPIRDVNIFLMPLGDFTPLLNLIYTTVDPDNSGKEYDLKGLESISSESDHVNSQNISGYPILISHFFFNS